MAGYYGFSMSNNAVAAYEEGLLPASKISGVPTSLVTRFCHAREWHHSSKNFNVVHFFDPIEVRAIFGLEASDQADANPIAIAALADWKAARKSTGTVYEDCTVEWLEWGGTRSHRTASKEIATGCRVMVKGQTATVATTAGRTFTKRLGTRGFKFESAAKRAARADRGPLMLNMTAEEGAAWDAAHRAYEDVKF